MTWSMYPSHPRPLWEDVWLTFWTRHCTKMMVRSGKTEVNIGGTDSGLSRVTQEPKSSMLFLLISTNTSLLPEKLSVGFMCKFGEETRKQLYTITHSVGEHYCDACFYVQMFCIRMMMVLSNLEH